MMIPLTPDIQARMIVCNEKQRDLDQSNSHKKAQQPALLANTKGASRTPAVEHLHHHTAAQPPPTSTEPLGSDDGVAEGEVGQADAPIKIDRIRAPGRHGLRRSRSTYDLPLASPSPYDRTVTEGAARTLQRSQSMLTLSCLQQTTELALQGFDDDDNEERRREDELKAAERAASPSRIRYMRHIIGFRKYNKLPDMRRRIMDACAIIETMAKSQHGAYQLALDQVDVSLSELAKAEQAFYRATDQVKHYEEKVDELDYLKANIELCIKKSIAIVKEQYFTEYIQRRACQRSVTSERKWRDSKEIRVYVDRLKDGLKTNQEEEEKKGNVPALWTIEQQISAARAKCAQRPRWHHLQPLFEAEDELSELQAHLDTIQRSESMLKTSLLQYQATTNTLLNVNREIKATTRILIAKAVLATRISDSETRDLEEEERLLREFVATGRRFDDRRDSLSPVVSPLDRLQPMSTETPCTPPSPPVWLTQWTGATKVLTKHSPEERL